MYDITVVITAYNLEKYILGCLSELEGQTFRNFDVVIVDDCSKDRTVSLVKEYQEKGSLPITLLSTGRNCGLPGRVRNFALDSGLIQGKYVVFLDGDDSIQKNFLEKLYCTAEEHQAEIAICAYDRFEEETGHILCHEMKNFPQVVTLPVDRDTLAFINGSLWNKLIRRDIIGDCRIPDFQVGEDLCFGLELYQHCTRLAFTDEELIHYRVRASSVISNLREETIYQFAEKLQQLWKQTDSLQMKHTLELVLFIHIGLSMTMRAYDSRKIQIRQVISWVSELFKKQFDSFRGNPYLRLASLRHHGVKGWGLFCARICYQMGCYPAFLWLFKFVTRTFRIDIKF